ncbi:MAG: hypothetical protein WDO72_05200 [Pseudomonadota bacterium]
MKSSRLFAAGAAIALLPLSAALAQSPPTDPAQQGTTFESLDTNSDNRISKTEAEANANVKEQFAHYDVNGDGFIERAEVTAANQSQSPTQKP